MGKLSNELRENPEYQIEVDAADHIDELESVLAACWHELTTLHGLICLDSPLHNADEIIVNTSDLLARIDAVIGAKQL